MLLNYLRIAFRNLWKNKSFTFINIVGLAVGMAITLLTLLYVTDELSFDRFHVKKDRIHRLIIKTESSVEGTKTSSVMTAGIGPSFLREIPEVEHMVRLSDPIKGFFTSNENNFVANSVMYADSSIFRVFSFPLLLGNPESVLIEPYTVVLTRSLAEKMFEDVNTAIGKVVRYKDKDDLRVTGIVEDPPVNSHLRFDVLISFVSLYHDPQMSLDWNGGWNYHTYLLLVEGANIKKVEEQFVPIAEENINKDQRGIGEIWSFFLQPLNKVHLNTNVDWDIDTKGSRGQLLLFIAVTFIILIIACINFINLTTAAALTRMKEVGVRKVSGATKRQIITQFLTETMLISIFALVHAIIFIEVFYLWLSQNVTDPVFLENFELYNKSFFQLAGGIIFLIISVGLIAGAYPAFYISGFKPALAVKGKIEFNKRNPIIRNLLVVFQFTISIILIICTLVIAAQLDYMLKTNKGFDPENKIVITLTSESAMDKVQILKEEFLSIPGIEQAGASSNIPGRGYTMNGYFPEGHSEPLMFHALDVDYDYLPAMGLQVVQGRNFSKEFGQDKEAYLINQALAQKLGWKNPVGKTIRRGGEHRIIGVVKNYNFSPLHKTIEPLIFTLRPWRGYSYITLNTSGITKNLKNELETKWKSVVPYEDFNSIRLATYVNDAYGGVQEYLYMLMFCSILAVFIAALGLFGLAAFTTRQRYKEIAVRKVFGAGINKIFILVSTGFIKWVVLANIIAWPLAYLIMENYFLANFAYNNGIKWWVYFAALVFSIVISSLVILVQILRLGRLNPVEYIRYE
ncbi:MAG: ABC transporter permease [Bacteroidales bacterium]|nr:ABC transporter permease [Bacteroidales bacterium]